MTAHWIVPALSFCLAACGSQPPAAAPPPSVLTTVTPLTRGSLPDTVTAYGSTGATLSGSQALSVAQPGQVMQVSVVPGAVVRAGQPMLTFATSPSARSGYLQALDALSAAQKQRDTTAQLLGQQLATRDQLVQAEKAVSAAGTALAALRAEGAGQAQQILRAPFDGVVTTVSVAQGDRTQAGAPLVTGAQASGLVVTVGVDPVDVPRLRSGQPVVLQRLAGGPQVNGRVARVGGALNVKTRLVDVDIAFPAGDLLPGEAVRAAIAVGEVAGWVVPHRAVVTANGPPHVFQAISGKAKALPVQISLSSSAGDVVQGALDPAHPLIVDGAYQVTDGVAIRSAGR